MPVLCKQKACNAKLAEFMLAGCNKIAKSLTAIYPAHEMVDQPHYEPLALNGALDIEGKRQCDYYKI